MDASEQQVEAEVKNIHNVNLNLNLVFACVHLWLN